ncbi:MAG: PLP-dependent aspartate aminotransferase family protein [Gemmatimonadota bacterium]|jgi:cystathionine beta-lyase/cystathionine gamma-synthase|nr:cystathionine gamma-synthase [Gemmatimonadota bacterium]MDP6529913.1 PLP-dependent aspartate aminotransferase family protein [Gemmatimonadota bacterium]MDP6802150.1 PLP-dependent aspartate aminotransferase family protein [Gemmatimonadota bacterium]MDP7032085.1 PLP-dependent aspartate aminotransferase family protein [Gemmatimonadota bacterium]
MGFSTDAIHAGQRPDPTTGAIITPIYQTSTYVQDSIACHKGYEYSRTENPTREAYEANVATLEGARHGIAFGSGMAAIDAIGSLLDAGDHLLLTDDVYGGTFRLFDKVRRRFGLSFDRVDTTDLAAVRDAIRPETRMLFAESPTNPTLRISDLRALADLCHEKNMLLAVDNTFMTPFFQRPFELGADLVVHSATKYLGGHSDTIGGIVLAQDDALEERIRFLQKSVGAVPGPLDCWLILRGTKTLAVRMERHESNAREIASRLDSHDAVSRTLYPGLPNHPGHDLATRQMSGYGAMISFDVGSRECARTLLESLSIFALAESLGGVESLVSAPGEMTHASVPEEARLAMGITPGFVRLSVGIEDLEDLWEDLERGFSQMKG